MIQPTKWLSTVLIVLAVGFGLGSVVVFAGWPIGSLRIVQPRWPEAAVLAWDAALSMLFFAQHSGMVRRNVRARFTAVVAPVYWRAAYAIASGIALAAVVLLWQPSGIRIYSLTGLARLFSKGLGIAAAGLFAWGFVSLRSFDPLGVVGLAGHVRSRPAPACDFAVRGAYRLVRHPLYLAIIVAFWSFPDVSADRLLLNVLWTAWMVVGTLLEEADLTAEIGDAYRAYRRTVPMLLPWPKAGDGQAP